MQLKWQARFLAALPASERAALPAHPRRPSLAFLGSPRFAMALWRTFRRDQPSDTDEVIALKRKMRVSLVREAIWMTAGAVILAVLIASGWRPIWP